MAKIQLTIILTFFLAAFSIHAQSFTFEGTTVPSAWIPQNGNLNVNSTTCKEGTRSLQWNFTGNAQLDVNTTFTTSSSKCLYFQLYSPSVTNDKITIEFCDNNNVVKKSCIILVNFKGWREICRYYTEFESSSDVAVSKVHFKFSTDLNGSAKSLSFDDVRFLDTKPASRLIGTQWVLDYSYFPPSDRTYYAAIDRVNFDYFNLPVDIETTTPTTEEINALNSFKTNSSVFPVKPRAGSEAELANARNYANSLNILRNTDNTVTGKPIALRTIDLTDTYMLNTSRYLEVLAADASSSVLFNNFLDHLLDQGFSEGITYFFAANNYIPSRDICASLFQTLPVCNVTQKTELLKLCKWLTRYGNMFVPSGNYLYDIDSDMIYNYSLHYMRIALNEASVAEAIRDLKAFKRWYDRYSNYTTGGYGMLKTDGTGFHHGTHYNNYMYAYNQIAFYLNFIKGTPFQIEKASYDRYKKAIISYNLMLTRNSDNNRYSPFSLRGRYAFPLSSFSNTTFDNLIAAGEILYGGADNEARAAYNYFFLSTKYPVSAADLSGYYAFNYSPLGIYRGSNWSVSMRSPTTNLWGSEIYASSNRFGRYQSHGTLEVLYDGDLTNSGYSDDNLMGGWDWNVIPGTTTVHYKSWREMMPNKNVTDRFDQFAISSNFAGALAWNDMGLFSASFDQGDTWGSQRSTPTNLTYKKTVLAVDGLLIDMGTDINASGNYSATMETATNIFQSIIYSNSKPLIVNGVSYSSTYSNLIGANNQTTLLTTTGTGYVVPMNNSPLQIIYDYQTTPKHDGSDVDAPTTIKLAAKAYLKHGIKTSNQKYEFVVKPACSTSDLNTLATQISTDSLYEVLAASSTLHAINYKPKGLMAISNFPGNHLVNIGIVASCSDEGLIIYKKNEIQDNKYDFAVCNPNLRPSTITRYDWVEQPTTTLLTLIGKWSLGQNVTGVSVLSSSVRETQLLIELSKGSPQYFSVINPNTDVKDNYIDNQIKVYCKNSTININFNQAEHTNYQVSIYNALGQKIYTTKKEIESSSIPIDLGLNSKGVYLVEIKTPTATYDRKVIM